MESEMWQLSENTKRKRTICWAGGNFNGFNYLYLSTKQNPKPCKLLSLGVHLHPCFRLSPNFIFLSYCKVCRLIFFFNLYSLYLVNIHCNCILQILLWKMRSRNQCYCHLSPQCSFYPLRRTPSGSLKQRPAARQAWVWISLLRVRARQNPDPARTPSNCMTSSLKMRYVVGGRVKVTTFIFYFHSFLSIHMTCFFTSFSFVFKSYIKCDHI